MARRSQSGIKQLRAETEKETKMDTDALLRPMKNADDQINALIILVRANTAVLKEIKLDLASCSGPDKVQAIAHKVDQAIDDLSMDSQKVDPWVKEPKRAPGSPVYGQYPINMPLNPDNPVPWPPGYAPASQYQEQGKEQHMEQPKTAGGKK